MSDESLLERYTDIAELISTIFRPFVETLVVDHRGDAPVVRSIFNNVITGRKPGHTTSDIGILRHEGKIPDKFFNYKNTGPKNEPLKSSGLAIRNEAGDLIGVLAVHLSLSAFEEFSTLLTILMDRAENLSMKENFFFKESETDLRQKIKEVLIHFHLHSKKLSKQEKSKVVEKLIEQGALKQKGAITILASELGVSRQWVYMYLKKLK